MYVQGEVIPSLEISRLRVGKSDQDWVRVSDFFFFFGGFVCFCNPKYPPMSPIDNVWCVPSYTVSSPRLRGWPTEWALHTLPLPSVSPGICRCSRAPGANQWMRCNQVQPNSTNSEQAINTFLDWNWKDCSTKITNFLLCFKMLCKFFFQNI